MPDDREIELIGRLRTGDAGAFHRLVDQYAPRLYALAYRMLRNRDDAEDAVQETLSGAYRSIAGFRGQSALWTWLVKILVRQIARFRRDTRPIRMQRLDTLDDDQATRREPSVGSAVTGVDAKVDLAAALTTLSPDHRQIVVLREIERMSYEEISQVMSIPLGTVESKLYRARVELRKLLAEWNA